jgi:hypothetical protein
MMASRHWRACVGLLGVAALAAASWASADPPTATHAPGDPAVIEALSGVDFIPGKSTLDQVFSGAAEAGLIEIARDEMGGGDPGLRLRAYRALALYDTPAVETALAEAVAEHHAGPKAGIGVLYLRAAAKSLAAVAGTSAVDALVPMLGHPRRDIRSGAAEALAITGAPAAIQPLRDQLAIEDDLQTRLALSAALRALGA